MLKNRIETWIIKDIGLSEFDNWDYVMRFALRTSIRISAIAVAMVCGILALMDRFDLLLTPLPRDLMLGSCIAAVVGFSLTMVSSLYMGHAVVHLARTRLEFEKLSRTDMLSGLLNRRAFIDEVSAYDRGHLLVIDIDRFKQINDRYGHIAGDDVIKAIAYLFKDTVEAPHRVARIGGEEFAVLLIGLDLPEALAIADSLRRKVAASPVQIHGQPIHVSISGGLADLTPLRDFSAAYAAADRALYVAKAGGRNRMYHEADIRHVDRETEAPLFPGASALNIAFPSA